MVKKITLSLLLLFLVSYPTLAATTSKSFVVSVTVPSATSIAMDVFKVNATTNAFTPLAGSLLNFDPVTFNAVNKIYLPDHYFAIDVTPQGGAASNMQTSFTFAQGQTPNPNGHGIGWKTTATFVKVTGSGTNTTDSGLATHGPKKMLKDLNNETVSGTETSGGWLRVYIGMVTKDPNATFKDPDASEPLSNSDAPGNMDGTLTISSTVL